MSLGAITIVVAVLTVTLQKIRIPKAGTESGNIQEKESQWIPSHQRKRANTYSEGMMKYIDRTVLAINFDNV